jgi:hypothetical protein
MPVAAAYPVQYEVAFAKSSVDGNVLKRPEVFSECFG